MRGLLVAIACLVLVPNVAAAPPAGDEQNPEVVDAEGDVAYDPLYVGDKNQGYIDTLAAWFEYDPNSDTVDLTIKTADATNLLSTPDDISVGCELWATMTVGGTQTSRIHFSWFTVDDNETLRSGASYWDDLGNEGVHITSKRIEHTFDYVLDEPAYFVWHAERASIQRAGLVIGDPTTTCTAQQAPMGITRTSMNQDEATSSATFPIDALEPTSSEAPEELFTSTVSTPSTATDEGRTAAIGILLATSVLVVVAQVRRPKP